MAWSIRSNWKATIETKLNVHVIINTTQPIHTQNAIKQKAWKHENKSQNKQTKKTKKVEVKRKE